MPDEPPAAELLPVDREAADDDGTEDGPAVATWSRRFPRCGRSRSSSLTPSEPRTTGRGVPGLPAGLAGLGVGALSEILGVALDPVDASFALAVSITFVVDVTWLVSVTV